MNALVKLSVESSMPLHTKPIAPPGGGRGKLCEQRSRGKPKSSRAISGGSWAAEQNQHSSWAFGRADNLLVWRTPAVGQDSKAALARDLYSSVQKLAIHFLNPYLFMGC